MIFFDDAKGKSGQISCQGWLFDNAKGKLCQSSSKGWLFDDASWSQVHLKTVAFFPSPIMRIRRRRSIGTMLDHVKLLDVKHIYLRTPGSLGVLIATLELVVLPLDVDQLTLGDLLIDPFCEVLAGQTVERMGLAILL